MYPHERSLVKKLKDAPFALVGVNSDADREALRKTLEAESITWRSFLDGSTDGPISTAWNISGWPSIFVLDAEGKIRYRDVRDRELDRALETLLAEVGHEVDLSNREAE